MFILRQSTAVDVLIGPFVDGTDGATPEEAESPSVQLSKNGQTAATKNDVTTPTHDNAGYYNCEFDATDTNTVGTLVAFIEGSPSTFLQVRHEFQIMDTAAFDALFADGAEGPLQATTVGNTLDVSATGEAGLDWANIGSPTTAQNLSGTNIDVDQIVASVSGNVDGSVASVTGAVGSVTGSVGSNVELGPSEVNAEVVTALAAIDLDHLVNSALPTNWATDVAAGSVFDNIADDGTAAFDRTTDSLQAVRDHIGDGTNLAEAGGDGDHLTAINLPNQTMDITGSLSGSVGSVTGAVGSVSGNVDGSTASVTADVGITATAVDNIWDEDIVAAHNTADTAGAILNNILPEKNAVFSDIEFLWVAASDHVTPVTGASTTSVTRSIDGGAFGAGTGTLAEVGNGIYQYDASAADMNGTIITFRFVATGGTPGAPDDAFVTMKTSG